MNSLKIIFTLFLFSLLSSCDPGSTIKYEIVNKTKDPIKAKYQFVFDASGDRSAQAIIIPADSSKIISEEQVLGYITQNDESRDSIFLYSLTLQRGNKVTSCNFKDKKYWILEKKDDLNGTYKLIVDTSIFDKE